MIVHFSCLHEIKKPSDENNKAIIYQVWEFTNS